METHGGEIDGSAARSLGGARRKTDVYGLVDAVDVAGVDIAVCSAAWTEICSSCRAY